MAEAGPDDFGRVLLEVIPEEPTALSAVVEEFRARTRLDPLEVRTKLLRALARMLSKAAPVKIGKVTKRSRADLDKAVIEELEVLFLDREAQGWSKLTFSVYAELLVRWPEDASAPADVLVQQVTPAPKLSEETQQAVLLDAIGTEPTPLRTVIDELRMRTGLRAAAARNRFFGIMALLLMMAARVLDPEGVESLREVELDEIQIRFSDVPKDGWMPISAFTMSLLAKLWPMLADPPEGVLLKKSLSPARVNAAVLKIA